MKSNLFAKVLNIFLFVLVSFAMSASLVSSASAQTEPAVKAIVEATKEPPSHPNCQFGPINVIVPIGKDVIFYILNPEVGVDYTWHWADGDLDQENQGKEVKHHWNAKGHYKMYVTAQGNEYNNSCYTWITVVNPEVPTVTPTPEQKDESGNNCSNNVAAGNNNQINVCNNSGVVNVVINPAPVHYPTFGEIIGQAIADLLKGY